MMQWAFATLLLAQLSFATEDAVTLLQAESRSWRVLGSNVVEVKHFWPGKNGDLNRSGSSPHVAPFDLSTPTWTFTVPVPNLHSPVIDGEGNIYTAAQNLGVISLDRQGNERWRYTNITQPGNPVLLGNELFVCGGSGVAHAINLATGKARWKSKFALNCPRDAWAASGTGQTVIMMANVERNITDGNCDLVALNATDGSRIWRFPLCEDKRTTLGFNGMPSIVGNAVLFQDRQGGVHRLSLTSGAIEWSKGPYEYPATDSTGGLAVGPNGLIYSPSNYDGQPDDGKSIFRALDMQTGAVRWQRLFEQALNSAPAIGRLPNGRLAVITQVANNFLKSGPVMGLTLGLMKGWGGPPHNGTVMALDAETGETIWSFDVDVFRSWMYPQMEKGCFPNAFANPAIGGDGTVYVNWSGGYAYAIRDANGDGTISPQEVSKVNTKSGMGGETAIAPGLAVVPSCDALRGYVA